MSTGSGWKPRCRWAKRQGHGGDLGRRPSGSPYIRRAQQPKQRFILPGQWSGLPKGDNRPRKEAVAVQIPVGEVERRSLDVYELVAGGVA